MANITLHSDNQISATSVSNIFIDEYMSDANGEFVKIYLYLLRLMNMPDASFSISSIADKFEHTEKDIKRALCYWERMHLLRLEYDDSQNLTGICLLDSVSRKGEPDSSENPVSTEVPSSDSRIPKTAAAKSVPKKKSYSADEIRQFRENESIAELLYITERYLGRTLSATDIDTILYLYDELSFSTELIEYLVEHCVSKGHTSIHYIKKVALAWADSNIRTVAEAKQDASLHSTTATMVMKSMGISGRTLVPSETALIEKWTSEYGFSNELIAEACRRTIQNTHQPNFEYTDSILKSWYQKQIQTLEAVAKMDTEHQSKKKSVHTASSAASAPSKNKFNNFTQRSYDYDQLEKMLLTTTAQ